MDYLRHFEWINIPELDVTLTTVGMTIGEAQSFKKLGQVFACK